MTESPTVSVVIVNLNGHDLLQACLEALLQQDYPKEQIELVVVDNGSTDGSLNFLRRDYPQVLVIEAGRNLGFAGGNNLGARLAKGEYLAFINNDARAEEKWLSALVGALTRQPDYACAASKMLNQDGTLIDFVGTALNLYGRAFQIDEYWPASLSRYEQPGELLAASGGAMLIRRDIFLAVGGFDEDYIAYYEDVDLGWRLWLMGYKVIFVPKAVVYHRKHQTGAGFPVEQRYALSELNALRSIVKNYEEENLWRVLPLSLMLGVKRSLDQAKLNRTDYAFGHARPGPALSGIHEPEARMTRVAVSFLIAMDQLAEEMPRLMHKRQQIQRARKRSDAELFARFPIYPANPLFPWRQYHVVQDTLTTAMNVADPLRPRHGTRLLIITHETIGPKMAGPGIRAWEMACALSARFDVTLAAPGRPDRSHAGLTLVGYDAADPQYAQLKAFIDGADVVLAMGPLFAQLPPLQNLSKPAIVDLYDPFELEKLAQSGQIPAVEHPRLDVESMVDMRLEGNIGDFFICASERQRDFWLGTLLAAGRVNTVTFAQDPTLRHLIDVVPFGLPASPPARQKPVLKGVHPGIGPDDKVLLWNGGLWQWFDPFTLLEALPKVLQVRDDVKLFFAAGRHFDLSKVPEMPVYTQTVACCRELNLLDTHVFFGDWIPYDDRGDYLLEADLGISIHQPTIESHFSSRTRLLDCIWAGLPVVTTAGDPISDMVAARGLGRVVTAGDAEGLAEAILALLADESMRQEISKSAQALQQNLIWANVIEPIANFLDRVAFAPDALQAAQRASEMRDIKYSIKYRVAGLEEQVRKLSQHLEEIRQGRVMRILRAVDVLRGRES